MNNDERAYRLARDTLAFLKAEGLTKPHKLQKELCRRLAHGRLIKYQETK